MKSYLFKTIFFILVAFNSYSQELLPFVENYTKSDYQGDNQIWNIAQGNDKALYFANNHYLLRYDGITWEKYTLPNKTIIRSLLVDGNKIYTGSYKEFGYWIRVNGKMKYVSISKNKPVFEENENEEIWKIFKINETIYFQSFNEIFIAKNNTIVKYKFPFLISYCFVVDHKIYVASVEKGIYIFDKNKLKPIKGWEVLKNNVVHSIEKYEDCIYIFTQRNGVYVYKNGVLKAWDANLNTQLKNTTINIAKFLKNNQLVVGTGNSGVYIFDFNSNKFKNINRDNVLLNNSVLSIAVDNDNDLWLGLDNGITHIEVSSPIEIFYDNSGVLGSVYSVAAIDNGYLIASNHGIFEYQINKFSLLPNTQGQAWNITNIDGKYIVGHNRGTFLFENGKISLLNNLNGGWNLAKSSINNLYFQSNYNGISIYPDSKNLSKKVSVNDLLKPIKYTAQNKKNEIWAADNYRGLYRIVYKDNFEVTKVENITQLSNLKNDFGVKIFEFRNEILFLINNRWYTYNSISNKLELNKLFNSNLKDISDIVTIDASHFVVLQDGILYLINVEGNNFTWNIIQEKYYSGKLINDNLKISKSKSNYLLNLDDGFISLQLKFANKEAVKIKTEAFSDNQLIENYKNIKFGSEVKIKVISGSYGANKPNLFYKINDSKDFIAIKAGTIILNNLGSGKQHISVFQNEGNNFKKVTSFEFSVNQPWYFSWWMILLYFIIIAGFLFLYYKWNKMRYIQKLQLKEEELKHQKAILEIELKAEHELSSQEYQKHILELELLTKSSEVAGKSLSIAKQSEMIDNIQTILNKESDLNKLKSEIKKAIKINEVNKHEWETFETNLNQIHNDFIIKLSQKFPILTSKDIKLCIYLKMNLSSKEIAPLMNISFRGVELHRYRLRKKLQLSSEDNLSKFLLTL